MVLQEIKVVELVEKTRVPRWIVFKYIARLLRNFLQMRNIEKDEQDNCFLFIVIVFRQLWDFDCKSHYGKIILGVEVNQIQGSPQLYEGEWKNALLNF